MEHRLDAALRMAVTTASGTKQSMSRRVTAGADFKPIWEGDALMLLVGNGRRLPGERMRQANMENGLLNVVIVEEAPALNYLSQGTADRLLGRDTGHVNPTPGLMAHAVHDGDPVQFSLDGEMLKATELSAECHPGALHFHLGDSYVTAPRDPMGPVESTDPGA